jgi:DNA-binding response OmpR family regulator
MNKKILFIDGDVEFLGALDKFLSMEGYKVILASSGSEGLHLAYEQHPDLIIMGVSLPNENGFDVCKSLREVTNIPILMLTVRSSAADVKQGFAVGADDYMKKPFSHDELLSRVKALLRRGKNSNLNKNNLAIINYVDTVLKVDLRARSCTVKGKSVSLTATEFNLLSVLVQHPNRTLSIRTLLVEVWGDGYSHNKGLLSLYIHQLRKKLQDNNEDHSYIRTQWGKGYFFSPMPKVEAPLITNDFDRSSTDNIKHTPPKMNEWIWIFHIIIFLLLVVLAYFWWF